MSTDPNQRELEALRHRLLEYESAFAATAPRLAAFKQLEDLAREHKTTPEAIAAKAALDVLKDETEQTAGHIRELVSERDTLQAEVSLVLIQKKTHDDRTQALRAEVETLSTDRDELRTERDTLKLDCDRVQSEHDELVSGHDDLVQAQDKLEVDELALSERQQTLVENVTECEREESELSESLAQMRTEIGDLMETKQSLTVELEALRSEAAEQRCEIEAQQSAPAPVQVVADAEATPTSYGFDGDTNDGDEAFDRFFDADIDHDKSREWILK